MLEVLDSISIPGNPEKPNDDAFAHIDGAAVVMDGATGLGESLMPGKSDAAWLATFGARRLMAYMRDGALPQEAVSAALFDAQTSFEALRRRPPADTWETPFSSMMFVAEYAQGVEALWFGDCAALVKRGGAPVEIVGDALEKRQNEARRVAKLAEKHGLSPAAGINRPEYMEALRKARNFVNTNGHWAFGPDVRAADHVSSKRIRAPKGTALLLCSDGFLALASDYNAYDADALVASAQSKGLKALGEELRAIERNDAEGRKFPRFKTSDDATALLLRVA
ncbi:MAG TPA: protein phosphatase 2C domain-containing protein [Rhizomicrobium sp.]|nr:protein phosphatase 2C domain-containing protein [Rhizomicrobium sp.]